MRLKSVMLSTVSQTEKDNYLSVTHMGIHEKKKKNVELLETESRKVSIGKRGQTFHDSEF